MTIVRIDPFFFTAVVETTAGPAGGTTTAMVVKALGSLRSPNASTTRAWNVCEPGASGPGTWKTKVPEASAHAVPSTVPDSSSTCTVVPGPLVPVNRGLPSAVVSPSVVPVESAVSNSGAPGRTSEIWRGPTIASGENSLVLPW